VTNTQLCSFHGDTLVLTEAGMTPIRDIQANEDRVWAKDETTGKTGWRDVLAQYSNRYEEQVRLTPRDEAGRVQSIVSNRIHPYFARLAAGAVLSVAATTATPTLATEGYVYEGEIAGGAWVDAQHLQIGDELLGADGQWQEVVATHIDDEPFEAFNLTVDEYETYFVAAEQDAAAVWVHNNCYDNLPSGFSSSGDINYYGQNTFTSPDGRDLYQGHDGRYYDPDVHPPTPNQTLVDRLSLRPGSAR
jgi:hypothetical protein